MKKLYTKVMKYFECLFWFLKFLKKDIITCVLFLLTQTVTVLCELFIPYLIGNFIDNVVREKDYQSIKLYIMLIGFMIVITIVMTIISNKVKIRFQEMPMKEIQHKALNHLFHLGVSNYEESESGSIFSLFNTSLNSVKDLFEKYLPEFLKNIIMFFILLSYLIHINGMMSLYVLLCFIPYLLLLRFFNSRISSLIMNQTQKLQEFDNIIYNSISSMKEVRAYQCENWQLENITNKYNEYKKIRLKAISYRYLRGMFFRFNTMIGISIYFLIAIYNTLNSIITVGKFVSSSFYATKMIFVLNGIIYMFTEMMPSFFQVIKLKSYFDIVPVIKDTKNMTSIHELKKGIELKNVSFSYKNRDQTLKDIDLLIKKGDKIVLAGETGCGKTTILKLISKFYQIDQGVILWDGVSYNQISSQCIRERIGYVFQETYLFGSTIWDNIAIGNINATSDQIIEAAKMALVEDFIHDLPNGYQTVVGERGTLLSGGQKQRIAIARIILKNPDLIILDEATSNLDVNNEKLIIENLIHNIFKDKTIIAITHHKSMYQYFDYVYEIKNKKVYEN